MPTSTLALLAHAALGVAWVVGYVLWSRLYWRAIDPWARRRVGGRLGVRVVWEYREPNSQRAFDFRPRYGGWQWAIAGRPEGAFLTAAAVRLVNLALTLAGGLWPIALLLYAALWARLLSAVVAYPLLFLVAPLYIRYWHGGYGARQAPAGEGGPVAP